MEIPKAFAIGYLVPLHLRGRSLKSSKNQKGRPQTKRFFWYNSNLCHTQRLPHWTVQPGDLQHPGDRCFVSSNSAFQRPIHDAGSCGKHHEIEHLREPWMKKFFAKRRFSMLFCLWLCFARGSNRCPDISGELQRHQTSFVDTVALSCSIYVLSISICLIHIDTS